MVAAAGLHSTADKLLAARRLLAGMAAVEDTEVWMVDDREGLAAYLAAEVGPWLHRVPEGQAEGSARTPEWTRRLEDVGVSVLVAVGGDGTQRLVAQARPQVPVLPVAGGTNNVACWVGDETAAGMAAARYAAGGLRLSDVARRVKWIRVEGEVEAPEVALVDLAWVRRSFTGARAVWEPEAVGALVLAQADPARPGLSNLGGHLCPVGPGIDGGLFVACAEPGRGQPVPTILAPGLVRPVWVERWEPLALGAVRELRESEGGTLALDGERWVVLPQGAAVWVRVEREGPWFLEPERVLAPQTGAE